MKFNVCILFLFVSAITSAQKRYKFTYDIHLKNIPSTYGVTYDTIHKGYTKIISLAGVNDTILQSTIKIHGNGLDTILRTGYQYIQPIVKIALQPGEYDVEIYDIEHTSLNAKKIKILADCSATIITTMGYRNDQRWGFINSKRKLTQQEIDKIIEDYSNRNEPELIKNKTCFVSWQI